MYSSAMAGGVLPQHHHPGSTASSPSPPGSPGRPAVRLRGLSYLRNYTHTHLLSRETHSSSSSSQRRPSMTRSVSNPSPAAGLNTNIPDLHSAAAAAATTATEVIAAPDLPSTTQPISAIAQRSAANFPIARASNPENISSTSGWLPTEAGLGGASGIGSEPQSTASSPAVLFVTNPCEELPLQETTAMARTNSAAADGAATTPRVDRPAEMSPQAATQTPATNGGMAHQLPSVRFTAFQDPRAQRPSLVFTSMARILPTGKEVIKVGRYSERDNHPNAAGNAPSSAPVGFKSKVVSRRHCELWCSGGRWYIRDVKSSSGTFLNHIRLSPPGTESRPFPVNDGDIVQLGIDFKGGEEMIFRCVKIRVELNKGWQHAPSSFNVQSHKRLRELNSLGKSVGGSSQDCSICLGPIAPCQSLFVAPCSHTWHYKCIRVIINGPHWPHFVCPNCRSVADLEAELDEPVAEEEWEQLEADDIEGLAKVAPAIEIRSQTSDQIQHTAPQIPTQESDPEQSIPSDGEVVEVSDESDARVSDTAEAMGYMNIHDETPSPISSVSSNADISNATVPPVNIVRKAIPKMSGASSNFEQTPSRNQRSTRTPSPNGLPSSVSNPLNVEGPMTPRNDVGPFVFDGSAGRSMAADPATETTTTPLTPTPQQTN